MAPRYEQEWDAQSSISCLTFPISCYTPRSLLDKALRPTSGQGFGPRTEEVAISSEHFQRSEVPGKAWEAVLGPLPLRSAPPSTILPVTSQLPLAPGRRACILTSLLQTGTCGNTPVAGSKAR